MVRIRVTPFAAVTLALLALAAPAAFAGTATFPEFADPHPAPGNNF